jgi:hypothetical protein
MMIRSLRQTGIGRSRNPLRWLPQAALVAALIGCSTTNPTPTTPTLRDDFNEYRQIVVQCMGLMNDTLRALDEISVQARQNPQPAYDAFAKAVHRLEVDSIRVRTRTQAMRDRGDAYFEHWQEFLANVNNEQVRQLAAGHQPELKQSFEEVRVASQQVRETFRPFLSDLQKLRAVLEADPSLARISAQKSLILAAKDKGRQVQQGLDRILSEMNTMTALLRPPNAPAKG